MASKAPSKKRARKAPEPRGRRGQSAVSTQPGLREWLIDRLQQTPRPTLDQRVRWHLAHRKACQCRTDLPAGILAELKRRGVKVPSVG